MHEPHTPSVVSRCRIAAVVGVVPRQNSMNRRRLRWACLSGACVHMHKTSKFCRHPSACKASWNATSWVSVAIVRTQSTKERENKKSAHHPQQDSRIYKEKANKQKQQSQQPQQQSKMDTDDSKTEDKQEMQVSNTHFSSLATTVLILIYLLGTINRR